MKESKIVASILLMTLVIYAAFYLTTRDVALPDNQSMPWQSYVNAQGETVVFDLTLGTSTLLDAMRILGTEVEASLFEDKDAKQTLEVFFSSTKIGGIAAKVILNLNFNQPQFEYLHQHIKTTERLPTGNRKTDFDKAGEASLFKFTIESLSFIPKADLSAETIIGLFNKPKQVDRVESGVEYWHYPDKGLRIIVDQENKPILEFYTRDKL